jgi:hypothetical protein
VVKERSHIIGKKVAKIAMPRGSKPGERRGGRQPGTPNKKTALVNAAFDAATSNPGLSPLDFLLQVMREASLSPDRRIKAALAVLPYVHIKPERAPATDPAPTARQTEGGSDLLYDAIKAWQEGIAPARNRIEKAGGQKLKCRDVGYALGFRLVR